MISNVHSLETIKQIQTQKLRHEIDNNMINTLQPPNLQKQKLTIEELEAVVREHGIEKIVDAELIMLERDGSISVISKELKNQTIHKPKQIKKYGEKNSN